MGKTSSRSESSRASRKFDKTVQFYAKIRDTVASLGAQKTIAKKKRVRSRQKKLKAYDLSALSEVLPELKTKQATPAAELKLNSKSRQKILMKESKQLKTVLDHPVFQADPWAALHQHLQSTQPIMDEKPARKKRNGKKNSKGKKSKSKASSRAQSMDVSV